MKVASFVIMFMSGMVLSAAWLHANETSQTNRGKPHQTEKAFSKETQPSRVDEKTTRPTVPLPSTPKFDNPHQEKSESKTESYKITDALLTFFNGLLALLTLFLVIFGGKQARAAEKAANAAQDSVILTR